MIEQVSIDKAMSFITSSAATVLQTSALQAATPIVLALSECDEELRAEAIELFKQIASGELGDGELYATAALLAEILFPNADQKGLPGFDLVEAEGIAPRAVKRQRRFWTKWTKKRASLLNDYARSWQRRELHNRNWLRKSAWANRRSPTCCSANADRRNEPLRR